MGTRRENRKAFFEIYNTSNSITTLINDFNYECAKKELMLLGDKVYEDSGLMYNYLQILLYDHKYDEASELLEHMEMKYWFLVKAVILIKLNKLDELEKIYYEYFDGDKYKKRIYEFTNYDAMKMVIEKVLNKPSLYINDGNYFRYQIYDYSLDAMFRHVYVRHVTGGDQEVESGFEERTKFRCDVDLNEIYNKVKKIVDTRPDEARLITNRLTEKYLIKMPGYAEDDNLMYIQAHTLFYSNEIYTMYPSKANYLPIIDAQEENAYHGKEIKRLSQIEKFNRRYGK